MITSAVIEYYIPMQTPTDLIPTSTPTLGRTIPTGSGYHHGSWHCFTAQDGLPSSIITQILQDRRGDLWLRTFNEGVGRYDGQQCTVFAAEDGLVHGNCWHMLEDRRGHIWFATAGGLCRYDGQHFAHFTAADGLGHDIVNNIYEDSRGNIWFITGWGTGIVRYDGARFCHLDSGAKAASEHVGAVVNVAGQLCEDQWGKVWVAIDSNTFCIDGETLARSDPDGAPNTYSSIAEDSQRNLWFADDQGRITRYDGRRFACLGELGMPEFRGRFAIEDRAGGLWFLRRDDIARWTGATLETFGVEDGAPAGPANFAAEDGLGQVWFASHGGGTSCFDGRRLKNYTTQDGLGHNRVFSICPDRAGNLWFGTWGGGLNRFDGHRLSSFGTNAGLDEVEDICEDRTGRLWFATRGQGAYRIDGVSHGDAAPIWQNFTTRDGLASDWIWSIYEDRQGGLWFATQGEGVSHYVNGRFSNFTTRDGLASDTIFDICEDRAGRLWFATQGEGASRYDGTTHGDAAATWQNFTTRDGLPSNWIWSIRPDRNGNLWFATWHGVSRYDGETFQNFTVEDGLTTDNVWCLHEDRRGQLWFGTWGGGISRYDGKIFQNFTTRDGLSDDNVRSIFEDRDGHLWFGTYGGGVCKFDGQVFQTLARKDGLVHDAVQCILRDRADRYWIATEAGVSRYQPPSEPPTVHLTGLVADRRYAPDETIAISTAQQLVACEFQGASFTTHASQMAYVYRLEGHDDDWQTTYQPRVEYRDLTPGDYTFRVRAVDRDLNYSLPIAVALAITPDNQQDRIDALEAELSQPKDLKQLMGQSLALRETLKQIHTVADTGVTVLILGETGTGKGLAARAIHSLSIRKEQPLIQLNCGAIPEGLVESELFGHEKGAFTGAVARKIGRFELADKGTLFLDEIGDLPLQSQQVLLHILQDGTFQRVGGDRTIAVDVRVVAATNRDLRSAMRAGTFREDLYFRLSAFALHLPPLRERREDVPLLLHHFVEQAARHLNRPLPVIDPDVLAYLQLYSWPGNVRELEHLALHAVLVCTSNRITLGDIPIRESLPSFDRVSQQAATPSADSTVDGYTSLDEREKRCIQEALYTCNGIVYGERGAAKLLGIHPERLRGKMRKHGLAKTS